VSAGVLIWGSRLVDRLKSWALFAVPHPADDPFYRQPANLESFRPGEVIDARPIEVRLVRRVIKVDAWQVKFRSTNSRSAAVAGVTTVMIPRRPFHGPVRPLLSYQSAIDSLGAANDPSYTLRNGGQGELGLMRLALRRGWAVVATDYTGPNHAFGAGLLAGHLVLDGIRAAVSFEPAGFSAATPIGLWGYSGGAHATLFAAEQQAAYAPELNIVGAAAGGITGDLTAAPRMFEGDSFLSGVWFGAMIGISRELDLDLLGAMTPEGQALVGSAAEMTVDQLILSFPFLRLGDYLTVPDVIDIPGMHTVPNEFGQGAAHDQYLHLPLDTRSESFGR
jgi:Secretory lipase